MIEKIAASLARFICTNRTSKNDDSKYEILKYGFECIINTGIPTLSDLCPALLCSCRK